MPNDASYPGTHGRIHLARGASYLIFQTLGSALVYIIAFVILARIISTKQMGILTILQLVNATCLIFGTLSVQQGVIKFVAENSKRNTRNLAAAAYYQALRFTLLMSTFIAAGIFLEASHLAFFLLGDLSYVSLFQVLALDIFLDTGAIPVVTGAMLGLQMFKETSIVSLIVGGIMRQVMIIGLILILKSFMGLVYGWLFSDAVVVIVSFILLFRVLGAPTFDFPLRKLLGYSGPLTLGSIAGYAQTWFDRAILVFFVPISALGIYYAAWTAFSILLGLSSALGSMLFSAYSSFQVSGDRRRESEAVRLAVRYSNFILLPLALGLLAVARPALALFVGESYASGTIPLMILSAAFAFGIVGFTALSPVLLAREMTRLFAIITIVSVVVGLGIAYLLLPTLGIVGASISRGFVIVAFAALAVFVVDKGRSIQFEFKTILKTLVASLVMVAIIFAVELFRYGKLLLPVYVAIGALVYLLMLRILKAVNRDDTALIRDFLGERFALLSDALSWILLPGRDQ
ncbi:MAG: oligosaccharide flippase family protein [Candidatus Bathyarchaeia archaeon]